MSKLIFLKTFIVLFVSVSLGIIAWSYLHPMSETVQNKSIGINGSFEHAQNNLPINWQVNTVKTCGTGNFEIMIDTSNAKEGRQSLHFIVQECSNRGGRFSPNITQEIPAQTGTEYRLSFSVKNERSVFSIELNGVNAFQQNKGPKIKSDETINNWKLYEMSYTFPAPMKKLRLAITILSPGSFWIDDIKIEPLGKSNE